MSELRSGSKDGAAVDDLPKAMGGGDDGSDNEDKIGGKPKTGKGARIPYSGHNDAINTAISLHACR